jgi:hypothetical protein
MAGCHGIEEFRHHAGRLTTFDFLADRAGLRDWSTRAACSASGVSAAYTSHEGGHGLGRLAFLHAVHQDLSRTMPAQFVVLVSARGQ